MIDRNRRPGRAVSTCARNARRTRARTRPDARVADLALLESRVMLSVTTIDPLVADLDHDTGGLELHVAPTVDPVLAAEYAEIAEGGDVYGAALVPLTDTFALHSNPGASKVIYLDFNGHTTTGTYWNQTYGSTIVTPAFDIDGNTASFSNTELERIQYIWQRVAEDYFPFDVDVTTQSPGIEGLRNTGSGDTQWGIRVAIGGSSYDWFGSGAGGVAYVGSFTLNTDTPAFVFAKELGGGAEKYTAEAISHEVGHTLGLSHDGTPTTGYYTGHGDGDGWAPIMGVGYYENLTQWSKGEYSGASQTQDDLTIITTQNGFGYRVDDNASAIASASVLGVSGSAVSDFGVIERSTDVDTFAFNTGAGAISLYATPFDRGPNLDIKLELLNSSGVVVATSSPSTSLSASINATVAAGTYYLRVSGVGLGDPLSTGYTDYGSLGQYFLSGSIIGTGTQPPPPPPPPPATPITLAVANTTATEANVTAKGRYAGTAQITTMTFTVTLSQAATSTVTVNYATANGTAIAGTDYVATSGQLSFAAGVLSRTFTVNVRGDNLVEGNETLLLNLSGAVGATIADAQAVGTIIDNDSLSSAAKGNSKGSVAHAPIVGDDGRPDETVRHRIADFLLNSAADRPAKATRGLTTAAAAILSVLDSDSDADLVSVFDAV